MYGYIQLACPLVHAVGRLYGDPASLSRAAIEARPGEFIASVDRHDWKATGITIRLNDQKASIRTVNNQDNSALTIEFSLKKGIEAMYYFIPSLRTMIATGK